MPPSSMPAGLSSIPSFTPSNGHAQLPKIILLLLVVVIGIRLAVLHYKQRMRGTSTPSQLVQEEKDSTSRQPVQGEKVSTLCQAPAEKGPTLNRHPQSEDQLAQDQLAQDQLAQGQPAPTFQPIHPWTSPPQLLPGPYDSRFYPLPTIRRDSYDASQNPPATDAQTIYYTRPVSRDSKHSALHSSVTTSNGTGWRRNQWVVSGG